jgi:hypothetical protein
MGPHVSAAITAAPQCSAPVAVARASGAPEVASRVVVDGVNCWRCKRALAVSDENRGKTVKCPQCGTKQQLPL